MGIINKSEDLKGIIVGALEKANFKVPVVNEADGSVIAKDQSIIGKLTPEQEAQEFNGLVKFEDNIPTPTFEEPYSDTKETGFEKIAESISKEVLNYIVENGEVAMKTRMDQLESDFNTLLSSFVTSFLPAGGITPPGAVTIVEYNAMVASVQLGLNSVGGVGREAITAKLIAENEVVPTAGAPVPVQIK